MPNLIWSGKSAKDMQRLYCFIALKNSHAATRAVAAIRSGAQLLEEFPEVGKPIENMVAGYRDWPIAFGNSGYILRYHFDGKTIFVVGIRHQREKS